MKNKIMLAISIALLFSCTLPNAYASQANDLNTNLSLATENDLLKPGAAMILGGWYFVHDGDTKWAFQSLPTTTGEYILNDYYTSPLRTKVTVRYALADGTWGEQMVGVAPASTDSWKQFAFKFIVPSGAVEAVIVHSALRSGSSDSGNQTAAAAPRRGSQPLAALSAATSSEPSSGYISTSTPSTTPPVISETPTTTPTTTPSAPPPTPPSDPSNLVINPSAENETGGVPDNWYTDIQGGTVASFEYPVPGNNGGNAVQTTITSSDPAGGDAKWLWEPVPVEANKDYTFSEYYKSDVKGVLIVEFNMADGTRQFTNLATMLPTSDWTKVQKEFNVRPGTVSVSVLHAIRAEGTLAIDDVSLSLLPDGSFNEGVVSLSFDDGDASFYENVFPSLVSHSMQSSASQNVIYETIGQSGYMTPSQLAEINAAGIEIGSHSYSHPYMTSLSEGDMASEAANSKSEIAALSLSPVSAFAYPYGDFDDRVENAVKSAGYIGARATDLGYNTRNSDPYALRTENVQANTSIEQVKIWIDQAIANKTWVILAFHDVSDTPIDEYSITPTNFEAILDYLAQTQVRLASTSYVLSNLMH